MLYIIFYHRLHYLCRFLYVVYATRVLISQHKYGRKKNREKNKKERKKERKEKY